MPSPRIVVVGSSIIDMVVRAARLPAAGETWPGSLFLTGFGGKGANQAVMAAKLGSAVAMVSKVGDDVFGRDYLRNFADVGVDATHVSMSASASTGVASIWVEEQSGANQIIVVLGANDELSADDVEQARDVLAGATVVVAQWEVPLDAVERAFAVARAAGARTMFNPAPARGEVPASLLKLSDYMCPNEHEAAAITGQTIDSIDDAYKAGRELRSMGAGAALITLGERGAVIVDSVGARHVATTPVKAVDTTGAGDAFIGSFAHYVSSGRPVDEAVGLANRAAAYSVQRLGTQASFPSAADLG